jgi:hypothetical protein
MSNITELIKYLSSLTRDNLLPVGIVLLLGILAVVSFEIQTSQFELDKLSKSADLLIKVEPLTRSKDENIKKLSDLVIFELSEILTEKKSDSQLSIEPAILLALLLGLPWVAMSFVGIGEAFQGESDWYYGTIGALTIGFIFGFIGYLIPTNIHWFYRYVVMPIIITGTTLFLFYKLGDKDEESNV